MSRTHPCDDWTEMEHRFAEEYIRDECQVRAAQRAGVEGTYRQRVHWAQSRVRNPKFKSVVRTLKRERAKRCSITLDQVVDEHLRTALDPETPPGARTVALREVARLCGLGDNPEDLRKALMERVLDSLTQGP